MLVKEGDSGMLESLRRRLVGSNFKRWAESEVHAAYITQIVQITLIAMGRLERCWQVLSRGVTQFDFIFQKE